MKQNFKKWLVAAIAVLTLFCLIFIFSNSLKDSSASSEQSFKVKEILTLITSFFGFEGEINISKLRSFAHVAEFFALGTCLSASAVFLARRKGVVSLKKLTLYLLGSLGVCVCIAVLDELLQTFSEGRACELKDGLLDTLGALLGSICVFTAYAAYRAVQIHKLNKKENKNED